MSIIIRPDRGRLISKFYPRHRESDELNVRWRHERSVTAEIVIARYVELVA